jgi:hypothetical protein
MESKVGWLIRESETYRLESGAQTVEAPDHLCVLNLQQYLNQRIQSSIGGHAQTVSYESAHKPSLMKREI